MSSFKYSALIYVFFLIFTSCSDNFLNFSGSTWGTTYNICYRGDARLADSVTAIMASVDSSLSMFNPNSTLSRINSMSDMRSNEMIDDVFTLSKEVHLISNGAFDPSVGPLVELWGFGTKRNSGQPDSSEIVSALKRVGFDKCELVNGKIKMNADSMRLDFSAIAKGYGVDCVARMLERNGCMDYMVEIGGEVRTRGHNRNNRTWRIQIDAPIVDTPGSLSHERMRVIELDNASIATSGNYRNYRIDNNGKMFGHTISTANGCPVETETLSVSVIAPECALADALATACMAMPFPEAKRMLDQLEGIRYLFVLAADSSFKIVASEDL